jgi:ABC-2 type transport system ATP-binding protein
MLRVEGVEKTFPRPTGVRRLLLRGAAKSDVHALKGVDLRVDRGEVVGLVGPNGAGKTTLLKIIATLLDATRGSTTVDGYDGATAPIAVRDRLGLVLADDRSLYWRITGRQNLEFFGVMQGMPRRAAHQRADEMLERVGLAHRDRLVFGYSSGMRSRLSIARAMLAEPPLLVLDEPTRALDPVATADIGALLRQTAASGHAVLLSSHRLDEVESVCDRVVAVVDGTVRFDGTVAELAGASTFAHALQELLTADERAAREREAELA